MSTAVRTSPSVLLGLFRQFHGEVRRTPLLRSLVTFTNARGHLYSACCSPNVLPCEQPLKAHLSGAIAQDGVEPKLRKFCVFWEMHRKAVAHSYTTPHTYSPPLEGGSGF
jgi:hypothetical protein